VWKPVWKDINILKLKEIFLINLVSWLMGILDWCTASCFCSFPGDLLVLLIVFCKIDKLTLLNIKLINTLSTFRRCQDSRERGKGDWHRLFTKNHFDIDCLYHCQGNEQKQVAVHQFKIPINGIYPRLHLDSHDEKILKI
jgi:hypothetical protein